MNWNRFNSWLVLSAITLVFIACGPGEQKSAEKNSDSGSAPKAAVQPNVEDTAGITRIKHDVAVLTAGKARNYKNLESLNAAADYIKSEFEKAGGKVTEQTFEVKGNTYRNIICTFGAEDGDRLVLGAHYDVCDEQDGADDNASGIAGILEVARLIGKTRAQWNRRMDIVAYTLEEPPFFRSDQMGSAIHAQYLKDEKIPLKAMVCLEMIGYFSDEKNSQDYPMEQFKALYPTVGNYIALVGGENDKELTDKFKADMNKTSTIDVQTINASPNITGLDFSDHLNYWNRGYQAIMVTNTGFYRNKNYHRKTDTKETLDYVRMYQVIKGVYNGFINIQ